MTPNPSDGTPFRKALLIALIATLSAVAVNYSTSENAGAGWWIAVALLPVAAVVVQTATLPQRRWGHTSKLVVTLWLVLLSVAVIADRPTSKHSIATPSVREIPSTTTPPPVTTPPLVTTPSSEEPVLGPQPLDEDGEKTAARLTRVLHDSGLIPADLELGRHDDAHEPPLTFRVRQSGFRAFGTLRDSKGSATLMVEVDWMPDLKPEMVTCGPNPAAVGCSVHDQSDGARLVSTSQEAEGVIMTSIDVVRPSGVQVVVSLNNLDAERQISRGSLPLTDSQLARIALYGQLNLP